MQDAIRHGRNSHYWTGTRGATVRATTPITMTGRRCPTLNYNNPDVRRYFIDVSKYWIEEFGIDGYRCDVAWGPLQRTPSFWTEWRAALKTIRPDLLLLAEANVTDFNVFNNRFDLAFDWPLHTKAARPFRTGSPPCPASRPHGTRARITASLALQQGRCASSRITTRPASRLRTALPRQSLRERSSLRCPRARAMIYSGQEVGETLRSAARSTGSAIRMLYQTYYRVTNARSCCPPCVGSLFGVSQQHSAGRVYTLREPAAWIP